MPMAYYKAYIVWLINKDKTLGPIQLNGLLKYKGGEIRFQYRVKTKSKTSG